ncbi:MAG: class I SAM-dependent methyltransferase [Flavobacteriales bacterium]|nr:class I SAM-dependent methyltransferase [Flavobacteriales bacterium]
MLNKIKNIVLNTGVKQRFFLDFKNDYKILELGCGIGRNAMFIKKHFNEVEYHGIDILSEEKVDSFIDFQNVNLEKSVLPYETEYFDVIIFTHVLEHLNNPLSLGSEINRVLKSGGKIYVEAPNWTSILVPSFGFHREQHNPFNFYDDPTHIKPWTKHGIYEFLSDNCNFKVQKVGVVRNWLRIPLDFLIIIGGILRGNRRRIVSSFWNIYGWCVFGIAEKK